MSRLRTVNTLLQEFPQAKSPLSSPDVDLGASEESGDAFQHKNLRVEVARAGTESRVVFHTDPGGPGADRFRYLRMRLREAWEAGKLKSLVITSALPQDGKSTISLNLACALSEQGKRRVLLIEADLHHPTLIEQLQLEPWPGVAECIEKQSSPWPNIRRIEPLGFYLLPSGRALLNPTELLRPEAIAQLFQELHSNFDWILVDSPPLAPLIDALVLAGQVDASLLVVRAGYTPQAAVEQAVNLLGPKRLAGIILNGLEGLDQMYSKYYGRYGKNRLAAGQSHDSSDAPSSSNINP